MFSRYFKKIDDELDLIQRVLKKISNEVGGPKADSLDLLRHQLGSIDLSDVKEDEEMSETERKEYCAAISGIFPRLEKDIKKFLYAQLLFSSNQAATWDAVIFGRGTFNGIDLLLEHWKKANGEHMERLKPVDDFDKHSPMGEFSERSA